MGTTISDVCYKIPNIPTVIAKITSPNVMRIRPFKPAVLPLDVTPK